MGEVDGPHSKLRTDSAALPRACSPPAELVHPVAPADVTARTLLPPGRIEAFNFQGVTDCARVAAEGEGRMTAIRFANTEVAVLGFGTPAKIVEKLPEIASRNRVVLGSLHYLRYSGNPTFGLAWVSGSWVVSA